MKLFLSALALALFMEGIGFALFPSFMQKQLLDLSMQPVSSLRIGGICALLLAIFFTLLAGL